MAMMAITTSNSISVKPKRDRRVFMLANLRVTTKIEQLEK
jgi:hypothetical protein